MNRNGFVKSVYWAAAAVDGFAAIGMLYPGFIRSTLGIATVPASPEMRYALSTGAALMFGWTALLIWASLEPVARRGVLVLTVVPVIAGLALSTLSGVRTSYIPLYGAVRVWLLQGALVVGIVMAYRAAADAAHR